LVLESLRVILRFREPASHSWWQLLLWSWWLHQAMIMISIWLRHCRELHVAALPDVELFSVSFKESRMSTLVCDVLMIMVSSQRHLIRHRHTSGYFVESDLTSVAYFSDLSECGLLLRS
jgi:hypothetical protein